MDIFSYAMGVKVGKRAGVIDVEALPKGRYYDIECYYKYDTDSSSCMTLEELFISGGANPSVTYYVVDALPENPNVSDLVNANPVHIYILNDIPYVYGDAGSGNVWLGVTDALAGVGVTTTAKGFTSDITAATEVGVYVTYKEDKDPVDGAVYRITTVKETPPEMWVISGGNKINYGDLAAAEGVTLHFYVVDVLPETMEAVTETVFPIYILNDTGVGYISQDGTSASAATLGTLVFDAEGFDKGWTDDVDSIDATVETNMGLYFIRGERTVSYSLHYYVDGEWHGGGSGGIVDVEEFPSLGGVPVIGTWTDTQNAPTEVKVDKIYLNTKLTASEVQSALYGCTTVDGVDTPFCVLASGVDISTNKQHSIVVQFLQNTPMSIYEVIGSDLDTTDESLITELWVNENFAAEWNSSIVGWNTEFDGAIKINGDLYAPGTVAGTVDFVDTQPEVPVTQDPSKHIDLISMTSQFGNAEEIDETVIYRTEGSGGAQLWFKNGDNLISLDEFVAQFAGTTTTYYVVDSLPSNPIISSNENGYHVYVLKSTGAAYSSADGSTYSALALVGVNKGWINSLDEITEDGDYTLRVGGGTAYGIPMSSAEVYTIDDGEWVNEPDALRTTLRKREVEIATLENEIAPLREENTLMNVRLNAWAAEEEGAANFAKYATLKVTDSGVEITGVTDTSITSITIPDGVTSIGSNAFVTCTSLTSVTIGNGVTSIGYRAFYGCSGLTSITIGNGVTSIESWTFCGCTSLTSVTIPDNVTSIGDRVFYNCSGLTSITIGNGVTRIGLEVFYGCSGLTGVYIADLAAWCGINANGSLLSYAKNLYLNNELVTELTIPDGVTSIGNYVFSSCTSLTSVTIGNGVTSIGDSTFSSCTSLTSVTIDNGVTSIGNYAFSTCTRLTEIVIPDSVTSIGNGAFNQCHGLTSINIPDGVTRIGSWTFGHCINLTSITIPDGVTSVGDYAVYNCSGLTSITIPDSVTSIGDSTFSSCTSMQFYDFTSHTAVPTLANTNAFTSIPSTCEIRVPAALYDEWVAAANWSTHASNITPYDTDGNRCCKITNSLTNTTSSAAETFVSNSAAFTTTLTAADGYELSTVTVTMGGTDVTADVYADGVVTIASVTGDVVITATSTAVTTE